MPIKTYQKRILKSLLNIQASDTKLNLEVNEREVRANKLKTYLSTINNEPPTIKHFDSELWNFLIEKPFGKQ